jgi:hypothetical protein
MGHIKKTSTMREYKPGEYKDLSQTVKDIDNKSRLIREKLISLGFDYTNKISGKTGNHRFYSIRDSILLRIDSVLFHYNLMNKIHRPDNKIVTDSPNPLHEAISIQQKFLFDSIIFNSISIFDYLGCLITFIKETNKDNWRKMWSSVVKSARNNEDFKNSSLAKKIIQSNKEWVQNLNDYRAELIHYQTDNLGSDASFDLLQDEMDVFVSAPQQLKKKFKQLKDLKEEKDFNINLVSLWIIKTCLDIITEIEDEIEIYIEENRKISKENAIYAFKK